MGDLEASPMEEDESGVEVRHAFECDLGVCGGRFNIDHTHTPECLAFTSGREKASTNSAQGGLLVEGQKDDASHGMVVVRERGDCSRVKTKANDHPLTNVAQDFDEEDDLLKDGL
ncbi:hypothetical protein Mapa_003411 [Marchantia paleacea]|nr:hypothetical protein Mapa_003411 [Marchantia paleacea]